MPNRAKRLCARCRTPHREARCPTCSPQQDKARGSAYDRGYTARWSKAAKAFLAHHPLCHYSQHQGITAAAECVDHAIPPSGPSDPLFWDPTNWRPSTIAHNSAKGKRTEAEYLEWLSRQPR